MIRIAAILAMVFIVAAAAGAVGADQKAQAVRFTASVAPAPPPPQPVGRDSFTAKDDWRVYRDSLFQPQGAYFPAVDESDYLGRPGDKGNWRDYHLADKPYVPGVGWPRRVPIVELAPPVPPPPPRHRGDYYYTSVYYYPPPPPPQVIVIVNNNFYNNSW